MLIRSKWIGSKQKRGVTFKESEGDTLMILNPFRVTQSPSSNSSPLARPHWGCLITSKIEPGTYAERWANTVHVDRSSTEKSSVHTSQLNAVRATITRLIVTPPNREPVTIVSGNRDPSLVSGEFEKRFEPPQNTLLLKFHGLPQSTHSTNYGRYARTPLSFAPVFGENLLNFPPLSNLGGFDFIEQIRNLTWQQNEAESAVVITWQSEHWSSFGAGVPYRSIDEGAKPVAQALLGVLSKVPDSESGVMFGRQKFQVNLICNPPLETKFRYFRSTPTDIHAYWRHCTTTQTLLATVPLNLCLSVEVEEGDFDPATIQQDVNVVAHFKFDEFSSYDCSSLKTKFRFMNRLLFGNIDMYIPVDNWVRHILMARNNFPTQWCVPMERTLEIAAKSCVGMNKEQRIAFFTAIDNVFSQIIGPPGTGKSWVVGKLIEYCIHMAHRTMVCAQSNAAIREVLDKTVTTFETSGAPEEVLDSVIWNNASSSNNCALVPSSNGWNP
ncbi:hypothetical protein HYALB_00008161 [Hymenoscyphus albidus]|uniref:DNA2/NAM7 helicase helicase domain-containing protein n=1 Tax=Hymenoscyphus albidus TaxID=595503 RepID=A0A9N9M4V5_9HELO|nr:hypothetical protein HYALB_00008161 [Hymenoscyphus albidus]